MQLSPDGIHIPVEPLHLLSICDIVEFAAIKVSINDTVLALFENVETVCEFLAAVPVLDRAFFPGVAKDFGEGVQNFGFRAEFREQVSRQAGSLSSLTTPAGQRLRVASHRRSRKLPHRLDPASSGSALIL
jgi:hypothetical protein